MNNMSLDEFDYLSCRITRALAWGGVIALVDEANFGRNKARKCMVIMMIKAQPFY